VTGHETVNTSNLFIPAISGFFVLWVPKTRPGTLTCTFATAVGSTNWPSGTARFTRIAAVHTFGSTLKRVWRRSHGPSRFAAFRP
jgi:hypothetical protein